jgi:hypothetical protein
MKQIILNKIKSITTEQVITAALIAFVALMIIGCYLAATERLTIEHGEIKIHF